MKTDLQWGGRFAAPPDEALLAFGSSLEDDLPLAAFDVRCSLAHVAALRGGGIVDDASAEDLRGALETVAAEIAAGTFADFARSAQAEDIHGAIDKRVRELAPKAGELLHSGRSRNDQVATTLLLYTRAKAAMAKQQAIAIARTLLSLAQAALERGTTLAAMTHWQPAQPVLLAFWLCAAAEPWARNARRFARVERDAARFLPLGSAACAGSTLPLDRRAAAAQLGFGAPSRNALDAIGNRDAALDLLYALARALGDASRVCEELIIWSTPQFGYARLSDAASTGSSLMPQKRNPDPLELVRASAKSAAGTLAGALGTVGGIALSYHRDLQETKAQIVAGTQRALAALDAFGRALGALQFGDAAMNAGAGDGYTVATDIADALVMRGVSARRAHEVVGSCVGAAERENRPLDGDDLVTIGTLTGVGSLTGAAPLDPAASVRAKATEGSTHPDAVRSAIDQLAAELDEFGVAA